MSGIETDITKIESSANDFDFLIGKSQVANKKLKERFSDCNEWEEFHGTLNVWKILNGFANVDKYETEVTGNPFHASTIRVFNPDEKSWSIFWIDTNSYELTLQVKGGFKDGVGIFYGEEMFNGKMVKLRFLWNNITGENAHWEQAYYDENKKEWEINWTMDFSPVE